MNTGDQDLNGLATTTSVTTGLAGKVDKEAGKGLSTNDFTTAEQAKLSNIAAGAEVNVQADWNQATTTADDYIRNKPIIPSPYVHPTGDGNLHVPATGTTNEGKVLSAGATAGSLSWAAPYSGLTNFTESNYTYNTKTGVKLQSVNDASDIDLVFSPKGTGAITVQQPDGTEAGGDSRGVYAADLQRKRELPGQVASGEFSILAGGMGNTATGISSAVVGGGCKFFDVTVNSYVISGNTASGTSSFIGGGIANTAIGNNSFIAGGSFNTATGKNSLVGGVNNSALSCFETVFGLNSTLVEGNLDHFDAIDRLFVVGNGSGGNRSNALTILKNANTTIGGSLSINGNGSNTSITFPITRGTNGQVLTTDGNGATTWTIAPPTDLTNFTESNYTFNTKTGVKWTVKSDSVNVDFVISPKGSGAILAQQPDGTASGGDNRGVSSVDFQSVRLSADRVASGENSFIGGGNNNAATGSYSTVIGGYNNTASRYLATIGGGSHNTASSNYATVVGGNNNLASGFVSCISGGYYNNATANFAAVGGGVENTASGKSSFVVGEYNYAQSWGETVIGLYASNVAGSQSLFVATDRLFAIGNGTDDAIRSNALTILKNANTTIGGSLAVNANVADASILFPAGRGTSGQFLKTDGEGGTSWSGVAKSDVGLGNVENTALTSWAGSANIATVGTITAGTWSGTSVAVTKGGTGATTKTAGFDALSPMTAAGDLIYGGTSGSGSRLGKGTAGQVLTMNAGATAPQWSTPTNGTVTGVTGNAPITSSGGTAPVISISAATTTTAGSMSADDKTKLDGIATNANNYAHPTGDGNLHVIATGTTNNGKVLTAGSTAGSLSWTTIPVQSVAGKTGAVTLAKADVGLGNVENTALSTWTGSANVTTLGTVTTGTWNGTAIAESYIGNLSASKITSGTFDNARINWAAPGAIGSTTRSSGAFSFLVVNNGFAITSGTVNIKPSGNGGTSGSVLTSDGAGNATWQTVSPSTQVIRFIICVKDAIFPSSTSNATGLFLGQIIMYAGSERDVPKNFLTCSGQLLNIMDYVELFSLFGTTYGGDGITTFALPDFTNRSPVGGVIGW